MDITFIALSKTLLLLVLIVVVVALVSVLIYSIWRTRKPERATGRTTSRRLASALYQGKDTAVRFTRLGPLTLLWEDHSEHALRTTIPTSEIFGEPHDSEAQQ
jgi:uncharacterized membrane protein YedE/YeeE